MPAKLIIFSIITFLHDLGTVIWIGGLITLGVFVFPAVKKKLKSPESIKQIIHAVQKRFRIPMVMSIVVLTVSGILMSRRNPQVTGAFAFDNPYVTVLSIKHIFVIGMVILAVIRTIITSRKPVPPDTGSTEMRAKKGGVEKILLVLNILFGIAVLFLSGMNSTMSGFVPG